MLAIMPLSFMAIFIFIKKFQEKNQLSCFECFSETFLIFEGILLLMTNLLSIFSLCTRGFLFISWIVVFFTTMLLYFIKFGIPTGSFKGIQRTKIKKLWNELGFVEHILFGILFLICFVLFLGALFNVPHNYDSMTYHMARIGYWIDNQSVAHYVTNIDRQLYSPVFAEYNLLHIMLLNGNDTFVNMLQYFSMILCGLYIYKTARALRVSRLFATLALFFFITMPLTISQSITTQNDLFASLFFAAFLYYLIWFIKKEQLTFSKDEIVRLILVGMIVGFAYLTKTSVCASMIFFIPWLVIVRLRKKDSILSLLKSACLAGITLLLVICETLIRTFLSSGTFMPETASSNIMVATKNVSYIIVNILKNFALLTTQHLWDGLNGFICRIAIHLGAFLKVEVNHEAISFHGFDFITHMNRGDNMYSHDVTPSPVVTYLALFAGIAMVVLIVVFLFKRKKETTDFYFGFCISSWLSLGFIMALLRWQPWGTRLMYPALAMMPIMIVAILEKCIKKEALAKVLVSILALVSLIFAIPSFSYNLDVPLDYVKSGCNNRYGYYFQSNHREDSYLQLLDEVIKQEELISDTTEKAENVSTIGLFISGDGYDYPLWLLFHNKLPNTKLKHMNLENDSLKNNPPKFLLSIEKETLVVGQVITYFDVNYKCVYVTTGEYQDALLIRQ